MGSVAKQLMVLEKALIDSVDLCNLVMSDLLESMLIGGHCSTDAYNVFVNVLLMSVLMLLLLNRKCILE